MSGFTTRSANTWALCEQRSLTLLLQCDSFCNNKMRCRCGFVEWDAEALIQEPDGELPSPRAAVRAVQHAVLLAPLAFR